MLLFCDGKNTEHKKKMENEKNNIPYTQPPIPLPLKTYALTQTPYSWSRFFFLFCLPALFYFYFLFLLGIFTKKDEKRNMKIETTTYNNDV